MSINSLVCPLYSLSFNRLPIGHKEPVVALSLFFKSVSREGAVHHLIPEGAVPPSTPALVKLNTSRAEIAALHLPPPPVQQGVTFFSFYTSLHSAGLYTHVHQRGEKDKKKLFCHLSPDFILPLLVFIPPFSPPSL